MTLGKTDDKTMSTKSSSRVAFVLDHETTSATTTEEPSAKKRVKITHGAAVQCARIFGKKKKLKHI